MVDGRAKNISMRFGNQEIRQNIDEAEDNLIRRHMAGKSVVMPVKTDIQSFLSC